MKARKSASSEGAAYTYDEPECSLCRARAFSWHTTALGDRGWIEKPRGIWHAVEVVRRGRVYLTVARLLDKKRFRVHYEEVFTKPRINHSCGSSGGGGE